MRSVRAPGVITLVALLQLSALADERGSFEGGLVDLYDGTPLSNVQVVLTDERGATLLDDTNEQGLFYFIFDGSGYYTLTIAPNGYRPQTFSDVYLEAGRNNRLERDGLIIPDADLDPSYIPMAKNTVSVITLTGIVRDFDSNEPISDVTVLIIDTGQESHTQSDGRFIFFQVPVESSLNLELSLANYIATYQVAYIQGDEYEDLEILLDPFDGDRDHDSLKNIDEEVLGTSRIKWDTDHDTYSDGFEVMKNSDPLSADSRPAETKVYCDVDLSGTVDAVDVQLVTNGALSVTAYTTDVNGDGVTSAVDVQEAILEALGMRR